MQRNEEHPNSGELLFQIDAGLLFQLGEQLVTRRSIALAELIKNAYDADATQVTILLENVTSSHGTIIVEDNGTGMKFEKIRDHWMRIATSDSLKKPISLVYGRPRTGAKGVGRFAARRLANNLILHSVAKRDDGVKERVVVKFDWSKFVIGEDLTNIFVPYERKIVENSTPTGVLLYLEDTQDIWNEQDLIDLQRDLFSLVNPYPDTTIKLRTNETENNADPGLSINLEASEFPKYGGNLVEKFLGAAWGELVGSINDQGVPDYHMKIRATQEQLNFKPTDNVFSNLIGTRFTINLFIYKSDFFEGVALSVRDAQKVGREQGGVRIYLDEFRVFPYGDPGDDWLQLDKVRAGRTRRLIVPTKELQEMENLVPGRPYLLTPGNNQLFGTVSISQSRHPEIKINISRERLVENETFTQLRRFVQLGIYWMTLQYARTKVEEDTKQKQKEQDTTNSPTVNQVIDQVRERVLASGELSSSSQRELLHILDYAKERSQTEKEDHISELSLLRVLSSTGTMIDMLNHQLRAVVDGIRAIHVDLTELKPHVSQEAQVSFDKILTQVQDWREMVVQQVSQLGFLLGPEARFQQRRLPLREIVNNVISPLTLYMHDFGIEEPLNEVPTNLRTPLIFEAELHAILLHIFTNALKAVKDEKIRKIAIRASKEDDGVHIFMLDTGKGIRPEDRGEVFKPFVTTSTPDPILGVGTGLGLKIVQDILEIYDGTARFIDTDEPWRTSIELILPDRK